MDLTIAELLSPDFNIESVRAIRTPGLVVLTMSHHDAVALRTFFQKTYDDPWRQTITNTMWRVLNDETT